MTLGRAIAVARMARGFDQHELAKLVRRSSSQLSLIESGRRKPSDGTLRAIADALGIDRPLLYWLAGDGASMSPVARRVLNEALGEWFVRAGEQ